MDNDMVSVSEYVKSVREVVHGPRYCGFPIYGKVNLKDNRNISEKGMLSNADWCAYTQKINTSPNNIRCIFIGRTKVGVLHYDKIDGVRSLFRVENIKAPERVLQLADIGKLYGILTSPWVCGNIEEIYIDMNLYRNNPVTVVQGQEEEIKSRLDKEGDVNFCIRAFLNGNTEGVNQRFPRLRNLGVLYNADYAMMELIKRRNTFGDRSMRSEAYMACGDFIGNDIMGAVRELRKGPSERCVLRKGDYLFDSKLNRLEQQIDIILETKREEMTNAVKSQYENELSVPKERTERSALEMKLDILAQKSDNAVKIVFTGLSEEVIDEALSEFSSKGEAHYRELLGLRGNNRDKEE